MVLGGAGAAINKLDENTKGQNAVAGTVGKATVDGKFRFTVNGVDCGATEVGTEFLGAKAQGEFCLVAVTVKNVGKSVKMFDGGSQKAYDAKGVEYPTDGGAGIYVNDQSQTFLENINPGNQVKGTLVFDVPAGTKLTSIVLHESM